MSDNDRKLNVSVGVDVSDALKDIQKLQREMITAMASMTREVSKSSTAITKEMAKSTSHLSSVMKKEIKSVKKHTGIAKSAGKALGKALVKGITSSLSGIKVIGTLLFKSLSGMASSFLNLGKTFGTMLTSGIRIASNMMIGTGKLIARNLGTGIRAGFGIVRSAAKGLTNVISFSLNGALKTATTIAGKITGVISNAINQKGRINLQADMGNYKTKAYSELSGDSFMASMNNMLSGMKATLPRQIASVFESVVLGVADTFSKLSNTVLLASQAFVVFKKFGPQVMSIISSLVGIVKPYLSAAMNLITAYIKLKMGTTFAPVTGALSQLASDAKKAGKALVDSAKNFVSSLLKSLHGLTNLWAGLDLSVDKVKKAFYATKDKITEFIAKVVTGAKDFGERLISTAKEFGGKMVEATKTAINKIQNIRDKVSSVKDNAINLKNRAVDTVKEGYGNLKSNMPETIGMLEDMFAGLAQTVAVIVEQLRKVFNLDTLGNVKDAFAPWLTALKNTIESISTILNPIVKPLSNLFNTLLGFSGDGVKSGLDGILGFVQKLGEAAEKISEFVLKVSQKISVFTTQVGKIIDKFTAWIQELPDSVQSLMGVATGVGTAYVGKKVLDATGLSDKIGNAITNGLNKVFGGMFDGGDNSFEGAVRRFSKAVDKFVGDGGLAGNIGSALTDAFKKNGLGGAFKDPKKFAKDMAVDTVIGTVTGNAGKKVAGKAAGKAAGATAAKMAEKAAGEAAKGAAAAGAAAKNAGTAATVASSLGKTAVTLAKAHPYTAAAVGTVAVSYGAYKVKQHKDAKDPVKQAEKAERERKEAEIKEQLKPLTDQIEKVQLQAAQARGKAMAATNAKGSSIPFTENHARRKEAEAEKVALEKYLAILKAQKKNESDRLHGYGTTGFFKDMRNEDLVKNQEELSRMKGVNFKKLGIELEGKYAEQMEESFNAKSPLKEFSKNFNASIDDALNKAAESAKAFEQKVNEKAAADKVKRAEQREALKNQFTNPTKSLADVASSVKAKSEAIKAKRQSAPSSMDNAQDIERTTAAQKELTREIDNSSEAAERFSNSMDTSEMESQTKVFRSSWSGIADGFKTTTDKIKNSLNSISSDVPVEEVERLNFEFQQAQSEFNEMFNIKGAGTSGKGITNLIEKVGNYSMSLAKIKNPLLTIRTEKASKSLAALRESAEQTKKVYNRFNQTSKVDAGIQSSSDFTLLEKMESKLLKIKETFNLLKSGMKTGIKFASFKSATADLAKAEADMVKMKEKVKSIFTGMFNGAKSVAKKGWEKISSIFKQGSVDCQKPLHSLSGLVKKAVGAFGLYQIGSVFKEATQSAIKYDAAIGTIQRTLGGASKGLIDFANSNAAAFGLSKEQVASFGNIYSLMVGNFESDATKVADTTQKLLESAGVIAGATGYDIQTVLENIRSGITGSSEAVDQLGLNLKTAQLAANAGVDSWDKLSENQKQAIIVQEILNQTQAKYGGLVDNAASRQAAFSAQLANTKLALGNLGATIWTAILPALTQVMSYLEVVFNYAASVVKALLKLFGMDVEFAGAGAAAGAGAGMGATDGSSAVADTNTALSDSYDGVGDAAKGAADDVAEAQEKMKGAVAGFDQLNILSADKDSKDKGAGSGAGAGAGLGAGLGAGILEPVVTEGESVATKIADVLKDVFKPLQDAWDNMSPRLLKAIDNFKEQFKATFAALGNYLKSVWNNGGSEFVQHLAEIGLAISTVTLEITTRFLEALEKMWIYLDPSTNGTTQKMIDALNSAAEATRDFILGITEHVDHLFDCGLDQFFMNFADTFHKAITACASIWEDFMLSLDALLDHLDPLSNEFTQALLDDMNTAIVAVGDAFLSFSDLLSSIRTNGGQEFINAIGDLVVVMSDFATRVVGMAATALDNLFTHLDPATNPVSKGCIESFTQFINHIRDAFGTLGDMLQTALDNGLQDFINNMADCVLVVADFAATLTGDLISAVANFFDSWVGHTVIAVASQTLAILSDVLKGLLELLNGPLAPLLEGLIAGFLAFQAVTKVIGWLQPIINIITVLGSSGGIVSLATSAVTALWGVLAANPIGATIAVIAGLAVAFTALYNKCEGFRDLVDRIIEGFKGFTDAIKSNLLPMLDTVKNIFSDLIDIIVGIFSGDGERVGEAVRSLVENIITLLGQFTKAFIEIGWELIKGLFKGIWECIKTIPSALAGLGKFVIDFFKGLFGIHSPSKEFATLGKYMIEGLIQGLSNYKGVLTALGDMAKSLIDTGKTKLKDAGTKCINFFKDGIETNMSKIKQCGKDIVNGIKSGCESTWDKLKTTGKTLGQKIKDSFCNFLGIKSPSRVMKEQGKYVVDGVAEGINSNSKTVSKLAKDLGLSIDNSTLEGLRNFTSHVTNAINSMSTSAKGSMNNAVTNMVGSFSGISDKIKGHFSSLTGKISSITSAVTQSLGTASSNMTNKFSNIGTKIGSKFNGMSGTISSIMTNVNRSLQSFATNMSNPFNNIGEKIGKKFNGITSTISGIFRTAQSTVSTAARNLGNAFNVSWKLPKLKLPRVSVSWDDNNFFNIKMPKFSIDWRRNGGLINNAGILGGASMVGAGEAGAEVIVPLENSTFADTFANVVADKVEKALNERLSNVKVNSYNGSNQPTNQVIEVRIGDKDFGRYSVDAINKYQKQIGRTVLNI